MLYERGRVTMIDKKVTLDVIVDNTTGLFL
jgi:hypothetical protein